jgi:hypothetical protein
MPKGVFSFLRATRGDGSPASVQLSEKLQVVKEPLHFAQKMDVLELYCGCGGLSFIDRRNKDVHIETKWAVDYSPSMCAAFKSNYPDAKVCSLMPYCIIHSMSRIIVILTRFPAQCGGRYIAASVQLSLKLRAHRMRDVLGYQFGV